MEQRETPCIGICTTLYDPVCQGCGRTQQEVDGWVFLTEDEKSKVWDRLEAEGIANRQQAPGRQIKKP